MNVMNTRKAMVMVALLPLLYLADAPREAPGGLTLVRDAHAVVGRPATPVSVAGVARRTTRRTVAATTTADAATPAAAPAPAAAQPQQVAAMRPAGAPAVGTVISALPAGCTPETRNNVEYQNCGGVMYRSAFQGNNLVYVAQ